MDSSVIFKTTSRNLARAMCMKNLKLTIIIIVVSIVSVLFVCDFLFLIFKKSVAGILMISTLK